MSIRYESELPQLNNFRCLEGYTCSDGSKIKPGLLYRSARPDLLTVEDCEQFEKFGIRTIIDLRRRDEYLKAKGPKNLDGTYPSFYWKKDEFWALKTRKKPVSSLPEKKHLIVPLFTLAVIWKSFYMLNFFIRWPSLLLALFDKIFGTLFFVKFYAKLVINKSSLSQKYFEVIETTQPIIYFILKFLSDNKNLPALVQCSQGKDRTGIVSMLVLSVLGVRDEDIIRDYAKSEEGLLGIRRQTVEEVCGMYGFKDEFTHAYPDTMIELLQMVRRKYGSVMQYLDSIGFDESHRDKLRQVFNQPATY